MRTIALIGTGFVADLYAACLKTFPDITVAACFDRDPERLARFCGFWKLPAAPSLDALLASDATLVLNLTNPHEHHGVSRAALHAGKHVYSEKPLATEFSNARQLRELATERGLQIGSAPCNALSQSAQTARRAIEDGLIGKPRLVYAELDDGFISQAPLHLWRSASGTPWPVEDELQVGCTLEHAGYYLTWLLAMFGPVKTVAAASAQLTDVQHLVDGSVAPDYSSASLFFENGLVARLTCSIVAPHDHRLRIFGDGGTLEVADCWRNAAPVKIRRRKVLRRRLVEMPVTKSVKPHASARHPMAKRRGAASMNFMLGPAEMLDAIASGRQSRLGGDFALHLTEVTLAIQNAGQAQGAWEMTTSFDGFASVRWSGTRAMV